MPYLLYPEPGPIEETLNTLVHLPLFAPVADFLAQICATALFVAVLPITIPFLALQAVYRVFRGMLSPLLHRNRPPAGEAIVITGCDSGFGYSAALHLASRGHTVFAICFSDETSQALHAASKKQDNLVRIICDVTRDSDVDAAVAVVESWVDSVGKGRRVLALVNNAGRGTPGILDLLPLSEFETVRM